jgi:hypothetical protein
MAPRYRIFAHIRLVAADRYVITTHGEPLDAGARVEGDGVCEPCSHEEARSGCYRIIARIASDIQRSGGEVIDVETVDDGFAR